MTLNLDHEYDEFLKTHERQVLEGIQDFQKKLNGASFRYGRFTIPTFYKPFFLTSKQEHLLKRVSQALSQIVNTAVRLFFEETHLSHVFRLHPEAVKLVRLDPGYSQPVVFNRWDALLEGEALKIIEINADAPAGLAYTDQLEAILLEDPKLQPFFEKHVLRRMSRVETILNALLAVWEEFGGLETPQIAITDWRNVRTMSEMEYLKAYFESRGYKTLIADPRELKYKGGKLYHKNMRIDVLYRRMSLQEIIDRADEVDDMLKAYRDRAVCMVNPLRSALASTNALLSILTNPEYEHFFTESENRIKRDYLPWTRRLADAEDFYGRKKVYLIDFLKDEKETLVLKPSTGEGAQGVLIGRETPDGDWNAAIDKALKEDWVVQEFVNVPIMTVPSPVNNKLDFEYKKYNFNLFTCAGKYSGSFVRLSDDDKIKVSRGGGMIPALASETVPER